jgi:hypothetical protein
MANCPHCSVTLPSGEVFARAAILGGPLRQLKCPSCARNSYLEHSWRNALVPILVLGIGLATSIPSPLSSALLSSLPQSSVPVARALIWSVATLLALAVFALASKWTPVEPGARVSPQQVLRSFVTNLVVVIPQLVAMVLIYRGLTGRS